MLTQPESNLIARAEKEVFLATNYWMDSDASRLITDSLKELSRRAGERGERAVVKIIYDRGNVKQVIRTTGMLALPDTEPQSRSLTITKWSQKASTPV